ncbi:hypothetical protein MHIB_22220 [Mycolicibacter hiberniae]|uniref:Uncharacterized protein n=1 Tax=Mycolicibacter hiberniae TaxID=29314 RepID=A0A7I7X2H3_9MYCO|nr:hypothetical protein MHIB_22220 [Mycolicibacter hiberniae]
MREVTPEPVVHHIHHPQVSGPFGGGGLARQQHGHKDSSASGKPIRASSSRTMAERTGSPLVDDLRQDALTTEQIVQLLDGKPRRIKALHADQARED